MESDSSSNYIYGMNILFGGGTDVDFVLLAARFEFICNCHIVAEQTVTWHFLAHNSGQHSARVNANAHLQQNFNLEKK